MQAEPAADRTLAPLDYALFPAPLTQLSGPALVINRGESLRLAGWELYPQVFTGLTFDSARDAGREVGLRLRPAIYAQRDWGIQKTTVYGVLDASLFKAGGGQTVGGDVGVSHVWEVLRNLAIRADAEHFRSTDPFVREFDGLPTVFDSTRVSMQGTMGLGRAFVALGGLAVRTDYDQRDAGLAMNSRSEVVSARVGYWNTPLLYSFAEASANSRQFDASAFDSRGARITGGIGTDRISLFKGELYAGGEQATYRSGGSDRGMVFGGRVFWYPLEQLTFSAQLDRSFGNPSVVSFVPGTLAAGARQTSGVLLANYAWSPRWSLSARAGESYIAYAFENRRDEQTFVGATINYSVTRSLGLTLDYQFTDSRSNVGGQNFARHVVSLGATEKY